VRPRASLPRTTKDETAYCCTPIINGKKFFLRTLKCYSWQSWARDPEESKSKPMVRRRERRAGGEPSLVIGRGHISWTIFSLMALTRQNQLPKSRQAASQPASQCRYVFPKTAFSHRNSRSAEASQKFSLRTRNGTARNNSQK
jgi:hypothetical protein